MCGRCPRLPPRPDNKTEDRQVCACVWGCLWKLSPPQPQPPSPHTCDLSTWLTGLLWQVLSIRTLAINSRLF